MPTKHKRKYSLSKSEQQQIRKIYRNLRQLHGDASRELRNIGWSISASKRADFNLQTTAGQIDSEQQFLKAILSSSPEPRVQVKFEVHPPYDPPCGHNPAPPPELPGETEIPAPRPAHLAELEQLIEFARQSGFDWTRTHGIRLPGVKRLRDALLKQLRFFREMTAAVPPLLPQFRVNECGICKLAKIPDDPKKN
jgi:hypothetical protein